MFGGGLYWLIFGLSYGSAALIIPHYLKPCSKNDGADCALKSAQYAVPFMLKGDKKFNIPVLNPLKLPAIEVNSGSNFKLAFTNLEVHGLERSVIKDAKIKDNHANVVIFIDDIKLMGDYTINGKILILPITGAGKCNLGFGNATFVYDVKWTEFDRNGVTYATLGNDTLNYDVKSASFLFENLFNGDKQLGDQMNKFLNENWKDVVDELGLAIKETINTVVRSVINNYFTKIPQSELFPK